MSDTLDMFGSVLDDLANGPHRLLRDPEGPLVEQLMRRLHEKGLTLEQLADRRIMNRKPDTLKRYARMFGLAFPDYVPRALKPKKEAA